MTKATMTKPELAELVGVSVRTVQRWVQQGCPAERDQLGADLLDPAAVLAWARRNGFLRGPSDEADGVPAAHTEGASPGLSASAPSRENLARAEIARKISIVRRNELEISAERGLKDLGLGPRVRAARTLEDLAALGREVAEHVSTGALTPSRGMALRHLIADARRTMVAARSHAREQGEDGRIYLATERGLAVLKAFEALASDARQQRVADLVKAELEADLEEFAPPAPKALAVAASATAGPAPVAAPPAGGGQP